MYIHIYNIWYVKLFKKNSIFNARIIDNPTAVSMWYVYSIYVCKVDVFGSLHQIIAITILTMVKYINFETCTGIYSAHR